MRTSAGGQTLESMSQAIWYNQWTLDKFGKFLHGDILEVGCGIGNFTKTLTKYGEVWAIDINKDYVRQTADFLSSDGKVGWGDIEKGEYFFKDKKFDCIVCLNVLEHIKNDNIALKNMYKLLRGGGHLILLIPAHNFLYGEIDKSIGHFRRYDKKQINKILTELGYKILKNRLINILGVFGWWFSSKVLSSNKVNEEEIKIFNLIAPLILPLENFIEPPFGTSILIIAKK